MSIIINQKTIKDCKILLDQFVYRDVSELKNILLFLNLLTFCHVYLITKMLKNRFDDLIKLHYVIINASTVKIT